MQMNFHTYFSFIFRNKRVMDKNTAPCNFIFIISIRNMYLIMSYQETIPINSSKISKVQSLLGFTRQK